jgi:hypothetical protein
MAFAGFKKEKDRADVVAYLKVKDDNRMKGKWVANTDHELL